MHMTKYQFQHVAGTIHGEIQGSNKVIAMFSITSPNADSMRDQQKWRRQIQLSFNYQVYIPVISPTQLEENVFTNLSSVDDPS